MASGEGAAGPSLFGAAAGAAARDPKLRGHAGEAVLEAAGSGAMFVKKEFFEVKAYIQESHCSLKILCFCNALALFVSSILGMINIFGAVFRPYQYLFAVYNFVFAGAIIIMDGKGEWFTRCCDAQRRLYSAAPVLASQVGRACFYFYVGSMNIVMLPETWLWKVVYFVIGGSLCLAGSMMLAQRFCGSRGEEAAPANSA